MKKKYIIETTKYIKKKTKKRILRGGKPQIKKKMSPISQKGKEAQFEAKKIKEATQAEKKLSETYLEIIRKSPEVSKLRGKYKNYQEALKSKNISSDKLAISKNEYNKAKEAVRSELEDEKKIKTELLNASNRSRYYNLLRKGTIKYSNALNIKYSNASNESASISERAKAFIRDKFASLKRKAKNKYKPSKQNYKKQTRDLEKKYKKQFAEAKLRNSIGKNLKNNLKKVETAKSTYNNLLKNYNKGAPVKQEKINEAKSAFQNASSKAQNALDKLLKGEDFESLSEESKIKALRQTLGNNSKMSRKNRIRSYFYDKTRQKRKSLSLKIKNAIEKIESSNLNQNKKNSRIKSLKGIVENANLSNLNKKKLDKNIANKLFEIADEQKQQLQNAIETATKQIKDIDKNIDRNIYNKQSNYLGKINKEFTAAKVKAEAAKRAAKAAATGVESITADVAAKKTRNK